MTHKLEQILRATAKDIMDAILMGFRVQVDVKGKLAELYLNKYLKKLENTKIIKNLKWVDKDGVPDFEFNHNGKNYLVECKNLRNETYKRPPSYKVEIQKTRNSKDGTNTRSYRVDYFDVLAVCMFNQTKKWDYRFIKSSELDTVKNNQNLLKVMHRVPINLQDPWKKEITDLF